MKDKIQSDLNQALKEKKENVVSTLRLLLAEIHNQEIAKQSQLSEEEIIGLIQKEIKQRKESIEAYQKGKRSDLVAKEKEELATLNKYLPQQLSAEELETMVQSVIKEIGASGLGDFGKVMGAVMAKVKGQADGQTVSEAVKKVLSQ
ncbi:aspartyl-tRNA amidotransferase [Microgenomates group bacterium RBG_19FT_COMBO_39_10]|nr:MAG: aspartyl-tRNA amidotransferase [Microgenomates group bacterium RBG_19FT_COMBO_39_10]